MSRRIIARSSPYTVAASARHSSVFADARRPRKKTAHGARRILQTDAAAPYGPRHGRHGLILPLLSAFSAPPQGFSGARSRPCQAPSRGCLSSARRPPPHPPPSPAAPAAPPCTPAAASSTRSMALSGRKRSFIYRTELIGRRQRPVAYAHAVVLLQSAPQTAQHFRSALCPARPRARAGNAAPAPRPSQCGGGIPPASSRRLSAPHRGPARARCSRRLSRPRRCPRR